MKLKTERAMARIESEALPSFSLPLSCLLAALLVLSACGGSSSPQSESTGQLSGNWQFTMAAPSDNSFLGGIQGGFLLQKNSSVNGGAVYAISLPAQSGGLPTLCNGGSASITGTISGQNVTLTAVAGAQTFALTGTISGSTMTGTYTSTDGQGCGTAQTGLQWSAALVPSITGPIQGNFHSVTSVFVRNQVFPVTGSLTQGQNIGASSATVTGTLAVEGYPCLGGASVNGQISGNSVILQIIATNGLNVGQIGAPAGFANPSPVTSPVTVLSTQAGPVLQGANGYGVSTSSCPGGNVPGDTGDICLALGSSTTCTQPILLSPAALTFPSQQVGSVPATQTVIVTNNDPSGKALTGLSLTLVPQSATSAFSGPSDFDGLPNFTEVDNCAIPAGSTFSLGPQQSCAVTVSFSPQQSCPWMPETGILLGEPPSKCPFPLTGSLTVNSMVSADSNTQFAVPITGLGFSAIVPSTPELDFGAEAVTETSAPQLLSFTNQGANAVQILPALSSPCSEPATLALTLPRPLVPGVISALQVDTGNFQALPGNTIQYSCDSDPTTLLPNFQISADNCSGQLLVPMASCSLEISFAPQPGTSLISGLDYFLELNTLQCTGTATSSCEIDSGRFPVELKANLPSPLRMTPGAGLNFGGQKKATASTPMTITLFNDPKDPKSATINFTGNILQGTSFAETDNCSGSLAPGSSCMLTVTFTPRSVGFITGTITVGYTVGQTQTIYLRGTGQ